MPNRRFVLALYDPCEPNEKPIPICEPLRRNESNRAFCQSVIQHYLGLAEEFGCEHSLGLFAVVSQNGLDRIENPTKAQ